MADGEPLVRIPPTSLLKIDLDLLVNESWLQHYRRNVRLILKSYGLRAGAVKITPSRRKGYHVRIYLDKAIPAVIANMFQWFLLDDHARVDFNRARIQAGFDEWDKLFERAKTVK
jgi:hypothetical protein